MDQTTTTTITTTRHELSLNLVHSKVARKPLVSILECMFYSSKMKM